ncbi:hypothetical protein B9Z19DRAFT_1094447 [Tuber borchii]|uniref:Uncharacterized protein n=1 Tax=Tuber borchii TaxID=42251 RepID=A0A2T6ZE60_TUBBO|nr:hypothetical protein B9Z19DRAFT_1094447 [Tuber borchii]
MHSLNGLTLLGISLLYCSLFILIITSRTRVASRYPLRMIWHYPLSCIIYSIWPSVRGMIYTRPLRIPSRSFTLSYTTFLYMKNTTMYTICGSFRGWRRKEEKGKITVREKKKKGDIQAGIYR